MSREVRSVFDTSVLVSALLFDESVPARAFYTALKDDVVLLSEAAFRELSEVLGRKKFERYVTPDDRERFLALLLRESELVAITEEVRACRDPKDDKFLEAAVNGGATCLVTGDQDLLVLDPFRTVAIITPARYLELRKREHGAS